MGKPDVIVAIATAAARSAIGIVRLSGPDLAPYVDGLVGGALTPRHAAYRHFLDGEGNAIDAGIAVFFPAPSSFTGEDVLELQGHGGTAVLQLVLGRCFQLGARLARPGEFSERAFLNGKIDLTQAEGIADLIEAGSEAAARAAFRSLRGDFSREVRTVVTELIDLRVRIEAVLDFPEEELDAQESSISNNWCRLSCVHKRVDQLLAQASSGRLLRDGIVAVLAGEPNVGKSSLLNRLVGEDLAIVTEVPGTTRDLIRAELVVRGIRIELVDTAGLRDATDPVERLGVERTLNAIADADVLIYVRDAAEGQKESVVPPHSAVEDARKILVWNKIDLLPNANEKWLAAPSGIPMVRVSARTGAGLDELKSLIVELIGWDPGMSASFMARERHLQALHRASQHILQGLSHIAVRHGTELLAEDLRMAQEALGEITGEYTNEDLLGEIFSRFCIGK